MAIIGGRGAVAGPGNLSSTDPSGRDFIDTSYPITDAAVLTEVDVAVSASTSAGAITVKVWRTNGTDLDLVGVTEANPSYFASNSVWTLTLASPFQVLAGDFIGVHSTNSATNNLKADTATGKSILYLNGNSLVTTPTASFSTLPGLAMSVQARGTIGGGGGDTISLTEKGDKQVIQRDKATGNRSVTLSGTYSGTPTAIRARILLASDNLTEVVTWTTLDAAPVGGTFSGTITVPEGGAYYHAEVDFSNDALISDIQTADWGVGIVVGMAGQSLGLDWDTDGTGTPNMGVSQFNGSWSAMTTLGAGRIQFCNELQVASGLLVGWVNGSIGSTRLVPGGAVDNWTDATAGKPYPLYKDLVIASGGALEMQLWIQGAQDAYDGVTEPVYNSALGVFVDKFRGDFINGSDKTEMPFLISMLSNATNGVTNANAQAIRLAQFTVATTKSNAYVGAMTQDLGRKDTVHLDVAGYISQATRMVQVALQNLGLATYGRGPRVTNASQTDSTHVRYTIAHGGGTDFTPASAITGIRVLDDGVPVTISSIARVDATHFEAVLAAPLVGVVTTDYLYGTLPDVTGAIFDNSAKTLPLEWVNNLPVSAAIRGVLGSAILVGSAIDTSDVIVDPLKYYYAVVQLPAPHGLVFTEDGSNFRWLDIQNALNDSFASNGVYSFNIEIFEDDVSLGIKTVDVTIQ